MTDFNLKITVYETAAEWILTLDSPEGNTSVRVPSPFTSDELTSMLHQLETSLVRSYSKVVTRRTLSPDAIALQFGNRLADLLLTGEARIAFEQCRRAARKSHGQVRVLLETNGASVSRIPWEFAVDPRIRDDYLALRISLARHLRVSTPVPPLTVTPPLRVLGVNAAPHNLPSLDHERERESVEHLASVSSDLVEVHWLPDDRWSDVSEALNEGGWHVLHFVGHGGFDEESGSGFVVLSDDSGSALKVPATRIGAAAASSGDLRLVVLNACESATTGAAGAFSSTAAKLMREGIPAVVAMQYEITDDAALAFAAGFYEALARGKPVDQAVTKAREIVRVTQNSLEWATPVLFLASDETRLFEIATPHPPTEVADPTPQASPYVGSPPSQHTAPAEPAPSRQQPEPPAVPMDSDEPWNKTLVGKLNDLLGRPADTKTPGGSSTTPVRQDVAPAQPSAHPLAQPLMQPPAQRPRAKPAPRLDPDVPRIQLLDATVPLGDCRRAALGPKHLLAMALRDGSVRAWDVRAGRWAAHCQLREGVQAVSVAWSPWPRHVSTAQDDRTVVVWDLEREVPLRLLRPDCAKVASMAFSASGRWLVVVGQDRSVQVFDAQGNTRRRGRLPVTTGAVTWNSADQRVGPTVFAPDGHLVVAANNGAVVKVDAQGTLIASWPSTSPVCGLAASTHRLATCSVDGRLRFWDWEGRHVRRHEMARAEHLAFDDEGAFLMTADTDLRLTRWSPDGAELGVAVLDSTPVGIGVGDTYVVSASNNGVVETWDRGSTVTEVEIIWPAGLTPERLEDAADELSAAGIETTCRIQPVRRGSETAVLILMTTTALEPFLQALFQHIGEGAYGALKRFVSRLFGQDPQEQGTAEQAAPDVVIFESTATGAQFLFTADLPGLAYEKALTMDAGAEPGRWMWNTRQNSWLRFESAST